MNRPRLPCPLFTALVAVAAPAQAWAALPPSSPLPDDVAFEVVDDDILAGQTGKYFGANMLVGVRVDIVSALHAPQGTAAASGSLLVMRDAGGITVQVDARSQASGDASVAAAPPPAGTISGGDLSVDGIAQVTQIAGDGNRMGNTTTIRFVDSVSGSGFNGQTQASTGAGPMTAQVSFTDGGVRMDVGGPGAHLVQDVATDGASRVLQSGQVAGVGLTASNHLQLQMVTSAMPTQLVHQFGIQQALSGLVGLTR